MLRGDTRAGTALGQTIGRLRRGRVGNPAALLAWGVACYAAIACSVPARAQIVVPGPAAVTGNVTGTSGTLNGNNGPGFFVTNGAELTINNATLENFTTTGGAGSGGGLGAGGAIFIDTGGTAILNNTSFTHDTAIGGIGGTSSLYGGTLNNGIVNNYFTNNTPGLTGVNGVIFPDNALVFGQGPTGAVNGGSGVTPCSAGSGGCAGNGGNAFNGFGGAGGIGGPGSNGWNDDPLAIFNVATATAALAVTTADTTVDIIKAVVTSAAAAAAVADAADPFELPVSITLAGYTLTLDAAQVEAIAADTISLAANSTSLATAVAQLEAWNTGACIGTSGACIPIFGNGGTGANGGNGGNGSYGFGGGPGGEGGAYGFGGGSNNLAGAGGSGGNGGNGGFGGGGGSGGAGYPGAPSTDYGAAGAPGQEPTSNISGFPEEAPGDSATSCTVSGCTGPGAGTAGSGGAGGAAGFGAGCGSTGGIGATGPGSGGCGGDGYGGAIFVAVNGTLVITGNATFGENDAYGGTSQNGGTAGSGVGTDLFLMTGSHVTIAPGAGNVITFNGTIADDSISSLGASSGAVGTGASLTIGPGLVVFNGANSYSGSTTIVGGAAGSALQAQDGVGLPSNSLLIFAGASQFSGGVLEMNGTFSRWLGPFTPPSGDGGTPTNNGAGANNVEFTGSGGFAANGGPLTVTLNGNDNLTWGQQYFIPIGDSLIFGAANSTDLVTFTNALNIGSGTVAAGTAASIVVFDSGNPGSAAKMAGVISGSGDLSINGGGYNGTLILAAVNTYTGATVINSGTLALAGNGSIATSSGVVDNGTFDISETTAGATIKGLSGSGAVALGSQALTITGTSTLSGPVTDGGIGGGTGGSLIVGGTGTVVTLLGVNTYTGTTTINGGDTLALSGIGSIAGSSDVVANGTFDISQTSLGAMITTLSGSGSARLGSKLLLVTGGSTTFSGVIADGGIGGGTGGALAIVGGTQTLSGVNTYTGATLIDPHATLALTGTGSIAASGVVFDTGTFDISQTTSGALITTLMGSGNVALGAQALTITAGASAFSGVIADGGIAGGTKGSLIVSGGVQTLSGTNTYTGTTTTNLGATLALTGSGSIATSSGLADNGTFDISQTTSGAAITTLSGSGHVAVGGTHQTLIITAGASGAGGLFSGSIADGGIGGGTGGNLTISGGIETFSGTNTYTGLTTIDPGATLALTGTGSIADSKALEEDGTFDISQTTAGALIMTLSGTGNVALGGRNLNITAGSTTFSGVIGNGGLGGGTAGSLTISGGTETLSGTNTYTGVTIIDPGATLALSGIGAIAISSGVADNGTFDISQTTSGASIETLSGSGHVALGGQALTITNGSTTFSGVIADGGITNTTGGSLIVSGGIETLSGINTYTGTTTTNLGATLALTGTGSIADSSAVIDNGTFDISQTSTGAAITTLSGSGGVALGARLLLVTNGSTTFSGVIADSGIGGGTGGMLGVSGGTQTLSNTNTYTGDTMIGSGATLALTGTGSIATSSGVADGGTFDISQTTSGAVIKTLSGSGHVALGGQALTIANGSTTFSGVIADGGIGNGFGGSLIINGGTETLSGANTYTGGTTLNAGTLQLSGSGTLGAATGPLDVTGGILDLGTTTQTTGALTLTGGTIQNGTLDSASFGVQAGTVTAVLGGSGALTKTGPGTVTLSGINTYLGATTVSAGILALSNSGSIALSNGVSIGGSGTFDISQTTAGTLITTLSGSGNVALGARTLTITAGGAGPNGALPAGIFSGVLADGGIGGGAGGALAITGGHQELTGVNTYTGGTTVTNGATLSVNNSASLGAATGTLTLNNGMLVIDASITIPQPITLLNAPPGVDLINLNSNNLTLSGAINGPGVLTAVNGGNLNLTGTVGSTTPIGGIVLGPGTSLTASTSATPGLGTTPIVVVSPGGTPTDVFTGSVHVVGPLDITNGATPELIILPGDMLVGVGSVNILTVIQGGGSNAPGDGAGTITVTAPVTNLPGSTYTVDIDGPLPSASFCANPVGCAGQYSSVIVTGTGNTFTAAGAIAPILRGIGAPANNNYTAPVGSSYTVVTATAGVLGSFSSITQPAVGAGLATGTRFDALYFNISAAPSANATTYAQNAAGNPTAIDLWVTPASYQNLSPWNVQLSQNQNQVAYALDALRGPAGPKNNALATWDLAQIFPLQPQNLPTAFNRISGEVASDAKLAAIQMTSQFLELMLDPTVNGRSGASATSSGALGFAATDQDTPAPAAVLDYAAPAMQPKPANFDQRWTIWGSTFGGAINASGDPVVGSANVSARSYGMAGGLDYRIRPDWIAGFALAGGTTSWNLAQSLGDGRSDTALIGFYSTAHFGPAYLAGSLSAANYWMKTDRFALAGDHLQGSFDAQSYGVRVEAGFRYAMPMAAITPYGAVAVQYFSMPSYSETDLTGGGFALAYSSASATDVRTEIGARFDSTIEVQSGMPLILRARAAWAHDSITDPALLTNFQAALSPSANVSFGINGAPLPANSALGSIGAELRVTTNLSLLAKFDGNFASGWQSYSGNGTVRYSW